MIRRTWHATGLHPTDPNLIALTGAGGLAIFSADGGANWNGVQLTAAVPGYNAFNSSTAWTKTNALYYSSEARDQSGGTLYAATDLGVYWTRDGGDSWSLFGAGLPNVSVRSLYLSPEGEFMRIATYGHGVWEVDLEH